MPPLHVVTVNSVGLEICLAFRRRFLFVVAVNGLLDITILHLYQDFFWHAIIMYKKD